MSNPITFRDPDTGATVDVDQVADGRFVAEYREGDLVVYAYRSGSVDAYRAVLRLAVTVRCGGSFG